ncbi:hypothetical protein G9F73_002495 [Clostridium estertheticum]|uniref:hypothetical protein n=1 Tax=Clostridium estertheticum TaxID=238834 RepID=UPI0013EE45A7|nr:hypothetical protein [Clostridium estertheticum]MBZ9606707.1 hypothetical protein [Clostridium estertheticum]
MSEMVLRLPSCYVDVERDEMEYVDGGATYSGAKGWGAASAMASIGAGAAGFASGAIALLLPFGAVGWLTAAISFAPMALVSSQLASAGEAALWNMGRKGKFTITTTTNPFALFSVS